MDGHRVDRIRLERTTPHSDGDREVRAHDAGATLADPDADPDTHDHGDADHGDAGTGRAGA